MTFAQVVETSVTNNSSSQNYTHPNDQTLRTTDISGFKPFTQYYFYEVVENTASTFAFLQTFPGNYDRNGIQTRSFDPPLYARFVRLVPRGWRSHISMRLELYGCPWSKSCVFCCKTLASSCKIFMR